MSKVAGIIGGMGPEATVDLMARVIRATPARDDQDHIRVIVDNNPQVPSRIRAIIGGDGESPGPCLAEMARKLEAHGADFLAMPCNTAHFYHREIQAAVNIPLLDMIELTVAAILDDDPRLKAAGILASPAVIKTGLYEDRFHGRGVTMFKPSSENQDRLFRAIREIKAGRKGPEVTDAVLRAAKDLEAQGAGAVIVACTELSVVASSVWTEAKLYDSAQVLAEAIVKTALDS